MVKLNEEQKAELDAETEVEVARDHTYRSRKWQMACYIVFSSVVLLLTDMIEGTIWRDVTIATLGLYAMGSVGDKFAKGMNK